MVDNRTTINTFHDSLKLGKLYESFFTNPSSTYREAMTRVINHAWVEEAYKMHREEEGNNNLIDRCPDQRRDD